MGSRQDYIKLLMKWLIDVAKNKTTITYGEVERRLKREFDSIGIGAQDIGNYVAGHMQEMINKHDSGAPLLNVLVVNKDTRVPGPGKCLIKIFLRRFPKETWLDKNYPYGACPTEWKRLVKQSTDEVYNYPHLRWENIYEELFKEKPTNEK